MDIAASILSGPEPQDLVAALRREGLAEVDDRLRRRTEYGSDASNYRVVPRVVVFPRSIDEVLAALSVARAHQVPLTARGAGTSTAGNAVGAGMVLDFTRHLGAVQSVDPGSATAVVQPGAVLDDISRAGAPYGLRYGPDPSTHSRASIGGSIGNNACGARALRYGRTADNVAELDVVTGAGVRFTARRRRDQLEPAGLDELVRVNLARIRTEFGRFPRQVSGYSLEHLLPENGRDTARFLVGSEGTLAIVLGATVRLVRAPVATALAVLGYPDMSVAAEAVPALLPLRPVAIEGMDARMVDVVRARRGPAGVPDLPAGAGWLFVETEGGSAREAVAAAGKVVTLANSLDSLVLTGAAARALWRIREDGTGLAGRTPAGEPAWPGWEDAAVPPHRLGAYLREFDDLMRDHGLDGLLFGHFGDGCVHTRIDFPLHADPSRYREFVHAAADLVTAHGGSLSGEHGDGRARGELLSRMYSPGAIDLFRTVKALFDPGGLLNPGVIVDPPPVDRDLRLAATPGRTVPAAFFDAVHQCVGVGKCRVTDGVGVMCPSYRATRDERDSTRGRARVLQDLAAGALPGDFRSPVVAEALDLCLSCKGCLSDCPAGVDMATYKAEVLEQRYRRRLRPVSHYSLGRLPIWVRSAARLPRLANALTGSPTLARIAKAAGGIDHRRDIPRLAGTTFRAWFAAQPEQPDGAEVLLFVDTFTNHFSPEVGQSAARVLTAAGYRVRLTKSSVCCGLTWISTGQLKGARAQLRRALDAFGAALAEGVPIVGLEPSCTAVLRHDAARLLPSDPRAATVALRTRTLAELLTGDPGWQPPSLCGTTALAQPHCHHHAVMGWDADAALLRRAGAEVSTVAGCCGLAGNFGVERGHFEVSKAIAESMLVPAVEAATDSTEILADGFSCRTQLADFTGRRGVHLAQLLDRVGSGRTSAPRTVGH